MIQSIVFYVLSFVLLASASLVVTARNPVHAVLFLVLCFFNAAALFLLMGAEFIAFILVIVYVGAVAVLFLFVVMMLDINFVELRRGLLAYLPVGLAVGLILLAELALVFGAWVISPLAPQAAQAPATAAGQLTNTHQLGAVIYTQYIYLFQAAGLILLIAMVGAIVLTLRHRSGVRKQSIARQTDRRRADSVEIKDVPSGSGVSS